MTGPQRPQPAPYRQWGEDLDPKSIAQMENACRLPISVAGALMPDAHVGYGLPIGGPVVNLEELLKAFHNFLADNARYFKKDATGAACKPPSPMQENILDERWRWLKLRRRRVEGQLLERDDVHNQLGLLAAALRGACERLEQHHGAAARQIVDEALDSFASHIEEWGATEASADG